MHLLVIFCMFSIHKSSHVIATNENNRLILTSFDSPFYKDPKLNPDISKLAPSPKARAFNAAQDTIFFLYTRKNPRNAQKIVASVSNITNSNWDKNAKTRFIFHGYLNDYTSDVNVKVTRALLQKDNFNVVVVDWGNGAKTYNYYSARSRIDSVAEVAAKFIDFLHENGFLTSFELINLIGHSLGAHMAGLTGKRVKRGKIQAIFGLDPAGPLFDIDEPEERLNATDAIYTESIHTNPGLLGIRLPITHVDFYANTKSTQPGCGFDIVGSCSHSRSIDLYAESLNRDRLVGDGCSDYRSVLDDKCSGSKLVMGGDSAKNVTGIFLAKTNAKSPFGL